MLAGRNDEQLVQLVFSDADAADCFDLEVSQTNASEIGHVPGAEHFGLERGGGPAPTRGLGAVDRVGMEAGGLQSSAEASYQIASVIPALAGGTLTTHG